MSPKQQHSKNNNRELLRYAGMGMQIFAALALAIFLGFKADKWFKFSTPLLVWLLPLLALLGIFYQVYKQTSKRNDDHSKK